MARKIHAQCSWKHYLNSHEDLLQTFGPPMEAFIIEGIFETAIPNYGQKSVYSTISLILTLERKQLTQSMPVRNI